MKGINLQNTGDTRGVDESLEAPTSGVAWGAIIGGAFVATAVSMFLLILGSGFGLAALSPVIDNPSVATFTVMTGIWLILIHFIASSTGGYITGRLRTKWVGLHTMEVAFRDKAHGFLTWAVSTVFTTAFIIAAMTAIAGKSVETISTVTSEAISSARQVTAMDNNPMEYLAGMLFRQEPMAGQNGDMDAAMQAEALGIIVNAFRTEQLSDADRTYLAQIISAHTGISGDEAMKRIDDVMAQVTQTKERAKETAEKARKAAISFSIFTALSMLIGAIFASVAAAMGGRHRDRY